MKKIYTITLLVFTIIFTYSAYSQSWIKNLPQDKKDLTLHEIQQAFNTYWDEKNVVNGYYVEDGIRKKASGWKQFKRLEWYWENRVDPITGEFPKTSAAEVRKQISKTSGTRNEDGKWKSLGPSTTSGGYAGLGRINCVAFIDGVPDTYFVGSPSGGLWKTTDDGGTWTVLTDENDVLGVSDILIYPSPVPGSETIYIATGDRDGGSIHSLGGSHFNDNHTIGVLKSTDGGSTWSATDLTWLPSDKKTVNKLIKHPAVDDSIWAACTDGVFLTTDAGVTWDTIMAGIEFIDMEMKPMDPGILYGSTTTGDIYKSSDKGDTWELKVVSGGGRIELAVSPDEPDWVYAIIAETDGSMGFILKSIDIGETFSPVFGGTSPGSNLLGYYCDASGDTTAGQGSYDLCIAVDPDDASIVFIGGVNTWKSMDGGMTWAISNMWTGAGAYNFCGAPVAHADKHNLVYQPGSGALLECNDGGFYKSTDGGTTWDHLGSGLIISQLYRLGVSQSSSKDVIIGLQDNGTKSMLSTVWKDVIGGDGMECFIDYTDKDIQYGEIQYGVPYRTKDGWTTSTTISPPSSGPKHWVTPFSIDPTTPTTIYIADDTVWKSTDQGDSWSSISGTMTGGSTLKSMAIAPSSSTTIYAAKSLALFATYDGGSSWLTKTGSLPVTESKITYISVKDDDDSTLWVSMGEYNDKGVFESTDGGTTWTNISAGLPMIPVMCVIQNKQFTDSVELYAATDVGVYYKRGSAAWELYSEGLPNVVVTELEIYYDTASPNLSRIRAATFGRGLWESELYSPPGSLPVADFEANETSPLIDSTVVFTDLTINDPISWSWTFTPSTVTYHGGTTSTSQNPEVSFNAGGDYTVKLVSANTIGSDSTTKTDYITVITPFVWKGSTSSDWSVTSNWENADVPDSTKHVIIPSGASFYPVLTGGDITIGTAAGTYKCKSLRIQDGGTVTVGSVGSPTWDMYVYGDLRVEDGGTLKLSDDLHLESGGMLYITGGTVENFVNTAGGFGDMFFKSGSGGSMTSGSITVYSDLGLYGGDWFASGGKFHCGGDASTVKIVNYDFDLYFFEFVIDAGVKDTIDTLSVATLTIHDDFTLETGSSFSIPSGDAVTVYGDVLLKSDATGAASLINEGTMTVFGTSTIERYVSDAKWHLLASPVSGETAASLYFGGSPEAWLKKYLEPTNTWEFITALSTPLTQGRGFAYWIEDAKSPLSDKTISFDGPFLSTDLTLTTFDYTADSDHGYNIVGNPFSSAIDWDVGSWDTTDINGAIWVWEDGGLGDGTGTYLFRNSFGAGSLTDGIIPMAQGFFIQVSGPSPSLTIPADARIHSTTPYYKDTQKESELDFPYAVFEVSVGGKSDEVWISFSEESSNEFDNGWDVNKLFSFENYPQLYIKENGYNLSIDALPTLGEETRIVNLSFEPDYSGEHSLLLKNISNLDDTEVMLEDLFISQFHDLKKSPVYEFISIEDDDPDRFRLHFNPGVTNIDDHIEDGISIYSSGKMVYISYGNFSENARAYVYDMYGREILSQDLSQSTINTMNVNQNNAYVIVITIDNGDVTIKKVFIR